MKAEIKKTPYIGFGNEQLENAPELPEKVPCNKCGKLCQVKSSKPSKTIQYIHHCGNTWLVGLKGKMVDHIKPKVSGAV